MNRSLVATLSALALVFSTSCKETSAPVPVATLSLSGTGGDLVPGQTAQLSATARDDAGLALVRPISWRSSDAAIASVVNGVVTGHAPGVATIIATAETASASISVSVKDGGMLLPAGGTITTSAGQMEIVVPAGVVTRAIPLLVTPSTVRPESPRLLDGSAFDISFAGAPLTQPLQLRVRFDPGRLRGTHEDEVRLHVSVGDQWRRLDGGAVDTIAHSVTGRFTGPGTFSILLQPGVAAIAVDPALVTLRVHEVMHFSAQLRDEAGEILTRRPLAWSTSNPAVVKIDAVSGEATALSPGSADLAATSEGSSATAKVSVGPGAPAKITLLGGNSQSGTTGSSLTVAPSVLISDADDFPVPDVVVHFSVRQGGGSITGADPTTDASGVATSGSWTLGSTVGEQLLAATVDGIDPPAVFSATAVALASSKPSAPPASMAIYEGDNQVASPNTAVAVRPAVIVTDASGSPVADAVVTFSDRSGGGIITGAIATTDAAGIARVGRWTLGAGGGNSIFASVAGVPNSPVIFVATAGQAQIRIITFGDSNTDVGFAGTNPTPVIASYVSSAGLLRAPPSDPNSPLQLAGKIEAKWRSSTTVSLAAINHGVSGTRSGGGRTSLGAPNAREMVNGVTRFAGEVLGSAFPWSGGETSESFPAGPILRVRAFSPTSEDFAYVSIGTNDFTDGLTPDQTAANLEWMVDQWVGAGRSPDHFIITTLAPRAGSGGMIPPINTLVRAMAARRGVSLIDLAARTSDDNGETWRSVADHVGDSIHYSEVVRDWLADQVVAYLLTKAPH